MHNHDHLTLYSDYFHIHGLIIVEHFNLMKEDIIIPFSA